MNKKALLLCTLGAGTLLTQSALAEMGAAVRAGTYGLGVDFDIGLTETLNLRLGYNTLNYDRTIEDTDVRYDGELKINSPSAILDWHAFGGGFRFSVGAVGTSRKIEVNGTPAAGTTVTINDVEYTASQLGSLTGTVKLGDSVAPYIGIGWGNTVDASERVTFLVDIGVINTGSPKVDLTASCGPALGSSGCATLQQNVAAEEATLENEVDAYKWYPVIAIGVAVRF